VTTSEALAARYPDVPDYQDSLARSATNLGIALSQTGRPAEAAEAHRKAVAIRESLVGRHPEQPRYRSGLGGALHNLGAALAERGRHEEAVARYREAIGHQRPLFNRSPRVTQYRRFLSNHYENLANSLRALGRAGEAAEATRERARLWPGDPGQLYRCACAFALCVPIAGDPSQKQSLADEAMAALNAAAAAGYSDGPGISRDDDLIPVRGRDDFRRLVLALMDRIMPPDPFTTGQTSGPDRADSVTPR
jgi:tetratricopeptide (TPR) repeat protein